MRNSIIREALRKFKYKGYKGASTKLEITADESLDNDLPQGQGFLNTDT